MSPFRLERAEEASRLAVGWLSALGRTDEPGGQACVEPGALAQSAAGVAAFRTRSPRGVPTVTDVMSGGRRAAVRFMVAASADQKPLRGVLLVNSRDGLLTDLELYWAD